jgi:hypothetical protein
MKLTTEQICIVLRALDDRTSNLQSVLRATDEIDDKAVREKICSRMEEISLIKLAFQLSDNVTLTRTGYVNETP